MPDEPVGRVRDEPDGGRDRHDGLARSCAGELPGRRLRARGHRQTVFFVSCLYGFFVYLKCDVDEWRGARGRRALGYKSSKLRGCIL